MEQKIDQDGVGFWFQKGRGLFLMTTRALQQGFVYRASPGEVCALCGSSLLHFPFFWRILQRLSSKTTEDASCNNIHVIPHLYWLACADLSLSSLRKSRRWALFVASLFERAAGKLESGLVKLRSKRPSWPLRRKWNKGDFFPDLQSFFFFFCYSFWFTFSGGFICWFSDCLDSSCFLSSVKYMQSLKAMKKN